MEYATKGLSPSMKDQGFTTYSVEGTSGDKRHMVPSLRRLFQKRSRGLKPLYSRRGSKKDGEVKEQRYSNLVGTFRTKKEGEEKALALCEDQVQTPTASRPVTFRSGFTAGASITRDSAERSQAQLNSKGIKARSFER